MHLDFLDLGGDGYAKVRLSAAEMRTEFVCIPRPITRSEKPDGGPLRYRTVHTAALWKSGERPQLKTSVLEGDAGLSIWLTHSKIGKGRCIWKFVIHFLT
jgi:alkaline phosphatase D